MKRSKCLIQCYIKPIRNTKPDWFELIWPVLSSTATQLAQPTCRGEEILKITSAVKERERDKEENASLAWLTYWAAVHNTQGMPGSSPALLATLHSPISQWQTIYGNLTWPKYIYKTCKKRFFQSEDRPEIVTNQPKESSDTRQNLAVSEMMQDITLTLSRIYIAANSVTGNQFPHCLARSLLYEL